VKTAIQARRPHHNSEIGREGMLPGLRLSRVLMSYIADTIATMQRVNGDSEGYLRNSTWPSI